MKISKQNFVTWKNDVVTVKFYAALKELRSRIEEQLLQDSIISHMEGHLTLNRLAGIREGLDQVLMLSIEDFDDNDDEEG